MDSAEEGKWRSPVSAKDRLVVVKSEKAHYIIEMQRQRGRQGRAVGSE